MSQLRQEIFAQRRFRQLLLGLLTFSVLLGLLIVPLEAGQGYFQSFEDGLWWASTTVTGVGYGDLVPVTRLGRLVGVLLQITGVGMLGLMIGIVSDKLSQRQERIYWKREFNQFDELHDRLDRIESQVSYLVREHAQEETPVIPAAPTAARVRQGKNE
jgi:hypothetical protein